MIQPYFIETIKILNGEIYNLDLHQERMCFTMGHYFGINQCPLLAEEIDIPQQFRTGLIKCRILYSNEIISLDFQSYNFRNIKRIKLVENNGICYKFKSEDRSILNELKASVGLEEEILIVKNRQITDTSFSNVVFKNSSGLYTPSASLLGGTKRKLLLQQGIINERRIEIENLAEYSKIYLINAMIDLEDEVALDVSQIY